MQFRVLGALEGRGTADEVVDLGGRQPRTLLAVLLASAGHPVSPDALVDAIWGDEPPASATGTVQSYVSRLRRRFDEARGPGADLPRLTFDDAGYRIEVDPADVDHLRFEALAAEGRAHLVAARWSEAREALAAAEALWRGPAFGELADLEALSGLATRLDEGRAAAIEDRVTADLELGRHAALVGELSERVAANPLRERLREQLALALYRSGRQADALRELADAASTLREELGIEPSRPLRDLEAAILAHDPCLDAPTPTPSPTAAAGTDSPPGTGVASSPAGQASTIGTPLVGRSTEVTQLQGVYEETSHDSRFAVVEGEPGIGKTRLIDEVRAVALARGAIAVWGRADEGGAAPALWPWLAPLRALVGHDETADEALAVVLSSEAPAAGVPRMSQFDRFELVAEALARVAKRTRLVVCLDDLQWADESSLELLGFLASRSTPGLLVLATMRQLEVGRSDVLTDTLATIARRSGSRRLVLRGLGVEDTTALIEAATGAPVPPQVAATIMHRSEGNPFYAIEMARLLGESHGTGDVPGGVADVIRRRVGQLPDATVTLLGVAAVVGRDVELGLLTRAAGMDLDSCLDTIEAAVVHRLLVSVPDQPSVLRFTHALVREVLLDSLTPLRRARLHLKVADAIEEVGAGTDDLEILAEHLFQAVAVGGGARAAEALERAAEVAVQRTAYGTAEDLLTKAVQLRRVATASASYEDREVELATICRAIEVARARRYYNGAGDLDRALELAEANGHLDLIVDLHWLTYSMAATSCRVDESTAIVRTLVDLAGDDPLQLAKVTQVRATHEWQHGRITDALELLDLAQDLYAVAPESSWLDLGGEQRMLVNTFHFMMMGLAGRETPSEVTRRFVEFASVIDDRFARASIHGFAAITALCLGQWDDVDAIDALGQAVDPGDQFAFWVDQRHMTLAALAVRKGDVAGALERFEKGRTGYTQLGSHSALAVMEAAFALVLGLAGHAAEAAAYARDARVELEDYGDRWCEPIVALGEAAAAAAAGDQERATERLAEARAVAERQGAMGVAAFIDRTEAELRVGPGSAP